MNACALYWFITMQRPDNITDAAYTALIRYSMRFFAKDDRLWKKDAQGHPKVVIDPSKQLPMLAAAHDNLGITQRDRTLPTDSGGPTCRPTSHGSLRHVMYVNFARRPTYSFHQSSRLPPLYLQKCTWTQCISRNRAVSNI